MSKSSRRKFVKNLTGVTGGLVLLSPKLSGLDYTPKVSNDKSGLSVEKIGTDLAYLSRNGKPVFAFGCHFEHMLFDEYDYEDWTKWSLAHGMNHCRARLYHAYYTEYSPFKKNPDGRFDLTQWDETWWKRFHTIMGHLQENNIIVHMLIFPQGSGGHWWQGDGYYLPENNVHPETAFIRPEKSTAGFWQSLAKGKTDLYEIQTAILWKLIEESVNYDNIYYDLCHEPFFRAMKEDELEDAKVFISETTKRFFEKYQSLRPDKTPILGIDTDFTKPGPFRDWLYAHEGFNIMVQGKNHDPFFDSAEDSIALREKFKKPYCPQESLDPPGAVHIPDVKHKNSLTYFESDQRNHIRKYVWRWFMAKSQVIDIYQKGLSNKDDIRERYNPWGHNAFEKDALVLRDFWDQLSDYPQLSTEGNISKGPGNIQMVLSSSKEAIAYLSSEPGKENISFNPESAELTDLLLNNGKYDVEIWDPKHGGGKLSETKVKVREGYAAVNLPKFTDDLIILIRG